MDMKLELVPIPVSDVDRAKAFYTDRLGFVEDVDVRPAEGVRVVQLTPPGSPTRTATPSLCRRWPGGPGTSSRPLSRHGAGAAALAGDQILWIPLYRMRASDGKRGYSYLAAGDMDPSTGPCIKRNRGAPLELEIRAWWAVRESNSRPPRCKRGALAC